MSDEMMIDTLLKNELKELPQKTGLARWKRS